MRRYRHRVLLVLLIGLNSHIVGAQTSSPQDPVLPDANKVTLLIRTTLLTLNDAIQTGNFTVFRDKAAPAFAAANTAAQLSMSFDNLLQSKFDMSLVSIVAPQLYQKPRFDKHRRLHLVGMFPGNPIKLEFDLTFQPVANQWRLFAVSITPQNTQK